MNRRVLGAIWLTFWFGLAAVYAYPHLSPPKPIRQAPHEAKLGNNLRNPATATKLDGVEFTRISNTRRLITKPIESIQVGDRVLGRNPLPISKDNEHGPVEFAEPVPDESRLIKFKMVKHSGKKLEIELLRSTEWIKQTNAVTKNTIDLDLPEMGATGPALVLEIAPCPQIAVGTGNIVTGRFKHEADDNLIEIYLQNNLPPIRCTDNHLFWSADRNAFIAAGLLAPGERLRSRLDRILRVTRIRNQYYRGFVYNIEVAGQHVYEVGALGILVHNVCYAASASTSKTGAPVFDFKVRLNTADDIISHYQNKQGKMHGAVFTGGRQEAETMARRVAEKLGIKGDPILDAKVPEGQWPHYHLPERGVGVQESEAIQHMHFWFAP